MQIRVVNPLTDPRWDALVDRHPKASIFHSRGWLRALSLSYGYEPLVLTTCQPDAPLDGGMVFCRVSSWITGTRLVSLPYADHCEPLLREPEEIFAVSGWLEKQCALENWKYVEFRPLSSANGIASTFLPSSSFCFQQLDLSPKLEEIFQAFHKDSIQRKIRRAEKENLTCETGQSSRLVDDFYSLMLKTRRRHYLFPQPRKWFRNLIDSLGDKVHIRVIRKNEVPAAAMLTLQHGTTVMYKYGCSDSRFHNQGVMPYLFWKLITESKQSGMERIDFGRSELDNEGLITFKSRFGTTRTMLTYRRFSKVPARIANRDWPTLRHCLSRLPDVALSTAGRVLYRHLG